MELFSGLIDPVPAVPADAVAPLRDLQTGPYAAAVGSLLVPDRELMAVDRAAPAELPISVINTTGAGGLTALAGRDPGQLQIVAVDNTVRDLVDPVGNITRIASAARTLDPKIVIGVQIPFRCNSYDQAVAEAEAEGMRCLVSITDRRDEVAAQLSALVEADLPFAASLDRPVQLLGLLVALDALIDDASIDDAQRLLIVDDATATAGAVAAWDDRQLGRIRRRLTAVRVPDAAALVDQLAGWQLIAPT